MKYIVNEYNLYNPKIKNNMDIITITDVHSDIDKMKKIKEILKELKVSVLLVSGDLIDKVNDIRNGELYEILKSISTFSRIFIGKGNHDQINFTLSRNIIFSSDKIFFNELSFIDNIHVFDRKIECVSLNDDIDLSAVNMNIEWYQNLEDDKEFENIILDYIYTNIIKFNILLAHSPNGLIKDGILKDYLEYFKDMNLILCGHMHGGLLPLIFRKFIKHGGICGPYATLFPKNSYGIYENDNTSLLISGGVTKISNSSELRRLSSLVDKIYPSEIEFIHLLSGNNNHLELVKKSKI